MTEFEAIKAEIDRAREQLLDLGNRNPLINFNPPMTTRSVIEVSNDSSDRVFRALCIDRQTMRFVPLPDSEQRDEEVLIVQSPLEAYLADSARKNDTYNSSPQNTDKELQTNCTEQRLNLCLINMNRLAKTWIEEQGVNTLYLSIGMLKWNNPDRANRSQQSPVLLIPVELKRDRAEFRISYNNGDELAANISLQAKLAEVNIGITWPDVITENDVFEDFDINTYFENCNEAINEKIGWEIDKNSIYLGFFAFRKYVMYKDLDTEDWDENSIAQDSVLMRLLGSGFSGDHGAVIPENVSLDGKLPPEKLFQVMKSDSSQTIVLAEARSGKNMVVQGPPGTGKSQTIVNLIAQMVAEGKTVLFVAEKLAALEVVQRRLESEGLGRIMLELYSNRTSRKNFIDQLRKAKNSDEPIEPTGFEENLEELKNLTEELNKHRELINEPIGESNISPFSIFGHLLYMKRKFDKTPILNTDGWENWSSAEYNQIENKVREFQNILNEIGEFSKHPFRDSTLEKIGTNTKQEIEELSRGVKDYLRVLQKELNLLNHLEMDDSFSLNEIDTLVVLNGLKKFQNKWWRWFCSDYRSAIRKIKLLWRAKQAEEDKARLQLLENAVSRLDSDIDELAVSLCNYQNKLNQLLKFLQIDKQRCCPDIGFNDYSLSEQFKFLSDWCDNSEKLVRMTRFNFALNEIEKNEIENKVLGNIAKISIEWSDAADRDNLADLVRAAWYESLWEKCTKENSRLNRFSAQNANNQIESFRESDETMLNHNKTRVLKEHYNRLPRADDPGMSILEQQFYRRNRYRHIRKLMCDAGHTIQKIKPVFMMSPFSVSSYLPRGLGSMKFDVIIFDEASQVRPVDAFGALMRGKQVIAVGDEKQLPPTTFFERMQNNEDADDEEDLNAVDDIESILALLQSKGAFSTMLRWHYRSRHDSLIRYSNHGFYGNRLIVFPVAEQTTENIGLQFVHLGRDESIYEGQGKNTSEAKYVAERVKQHIFNQQHIPDSHKQTLGVVAFSLSQSREINDQIEILRLKEPEFGELYNNPPRDEEPYFVKNLENVQGDERDVIFISVGYGYNAQRNIGMNLGPLNRQGGERRLNVLITRARSKCVVFSNMTADNMNIERINAEGVRHLKGYLNFAENQILDGPRPTGREPDSQFEIDVAESIREEIGWEVDCQVGSKEYYIDLAVKDRERDGRYILAVECDGASYHSSRCARDRDLLRQAKLEDDGWKFHRIWSQSWFYERETEIQKLKQAIEEAQSNANAEHHV